MAFLSSLITTIIVIFVNAAILTYLSQKFNLGDRSYITAITITGILGIFSFLLNLLNSYITVIITLPLGFYLIMWKYRIGWQQALKAWALFVAISLAAGLIIGSVLGLILALF